jgi:hypothetical protein
LFEVASGKERARFDGQQGDVMSLAFSPDGKVLAAGAGSTALLWDVTSRMHDEKLQTVSLSAGELEALWSDLYSQDGARAYRAVWTLTAGARQSVPFLQHKLKPVPPVDPAEQKRIAKLIADLNSDDFETREKANQELEKAVETVESELRKAQGEQPAPEIRQRLERVLEKLQDPAKVRERLRLVRANEVLEKIGTEEARQVLKAIAHGAPDAALTKDSRAALERLEKRGRS